MGFGNGLEVDLIEFVNGTDVGGKREEEWKSNCYFFVCLLGLFFWFIKRGEIWGKRGFGEGFWV